MELTTLPRRTFESFGFLMVRDFLEADHVQALRDAVSGMKADESGQADPLTHTGRVVGMFHKDPLLLALFDDPRLDAIARQLLGESASLRFLGDEYVSYSTPADWHPDMPVDSPFESIKFGFYLDDISRGGCLRVVPGSHHAPLFHAVEAYRNASSPAAEIDSAHACDTRPGDLLIFNLKLWHQGTANPAGTHRRVIFWSVGQHEPRFNEYARSFHERNGRGAADDAWPDMILRDMPRHRLEMLDVYEPGTAKQTALAHLAAPNAV